MINFYDLHNNKEDLCIYQNLYKIVNNLTNNMNFVCRTFYSMDEHTRTIYINALKTSPLKSIEFVHVTKLANKELEPIIAEDSITAAYYAIDIIGGRFEMGEKSMAKNAEASYYYAIEAIKNRFLLGEIVIKNSKFKNEYEKHFNIKL